MSQNNNIIKVEGREINPAKVDGPSDVFSSASFQLAKSRWQEDNDANICVLCNQKFNQIRRKHHCRQCGRVLCSKCCYAKMPLPQLGYGDAERVCDFCKPVCELVTKARSPMLSYELEGAKGLSEFVRDPDGVKRVVETGGLQTLIWLARQGDEQMRGYIISALHCLAMHTSLHPVLAESGTIKAVCSILSNADAEQILIDGISSLMIFCKSSDLKTQAIKDGALHPVLTLCNHSQDAIALVALKTLSLIVEHAGTHTAIIESERSALPKVLALTASSDEQVQEVSLKLLAHLSMGTDYHRQRIVQEDFTTGKGILKVLRSNPNNIQVLCNAACLVGNLATSEHSQGALQEVIDPLCLMLGSHTESVELTTHVIRAIANFAKYPQNAWRLIPYLAHFTRSCLKSANNALKFQATRCILHLLLHSTNETTEGLMKEGAAELLKGLVEIPELMESMHKSILKNVSERCRPM
ncbi:unnamed protein product [Owenia fusiformis]|uniref:Uncharacterized protein n=1 Tax=Owenia fusiformis TaxID=6347 RepID=A0A8J1U546_OWEFU|nr:unnamed protein product [Owenia fusiformis]